MVHEGKAVVSLQVMENSKYGQKIGKSDQIYQSVAGSEIWSRKVTILVR